MKIWLLAPAQSVTAISLARAFFSYSSRSDILGRSNAEDLLIGSPIVSLFLSRWGDAISLLREFFPETDMLCSLMSWGNLTKKVVSLRSSNLFILGPFNLSSFFRKLSLLRAEIL